MSEGPGNVRQALGSHVCLCTVVLWLCPRVQVASFVERIENLKLDLFRLERRIYGVAVDGPEVHNPLNR